MRNFLALFAALFLFATPALAAGTANSLITPQTPNRGVVQFLAGTDTIGVYKTLYTAGVNGSKLTGLYMNNNDGSATHLITCQVVNTAVKYGGIALTSVSSSGYVSGTNSQNMFSTTLWPGLALDANSQPYLYLASGDTIQCTYATALTASDWVNVVAIAADY